jgi:hypothetical protein
LYQFEAFTPAGVQVTVKPDGLLRLQQEHTNGEVFEHLFFLEVDRSTEPQDTLITRAACYRDYYRRGGLAVRRGHAAQAFEQFPFRVLIIFKNAERRNNTAARLLELQPPILTQVWLSTFAEVTTDPFGPVWARPADYRDALAGPSLTQFTVDGPYRRNRSWQTFIEQRLTKRPLVEGEASSC